MLTFEIPYSVALSKNRIGFNRQTGQRFTLPEKKKSKEAIALLIKSNRFVVDAFPLYVVIQLFRTRSKCDPQNVIDVVADAVALGLGCDDKDFVICSMGHPCGESQTYSVIRVSLTTKLSEFVGLIYRSNRSPKAK